MNTMMIRTNIAAALSEDVLAPELRSPLLSGMRKKPFSEKWFGRLFGRR
jgi:hypothetical protein